MSRTGCHGAYRALGLSTCAEHVRGMSYLLGFDKTRRVLYTQREYLQYIIEYIMSMGLR